MPGLMPRILELLSFVCILVEWIDDASVTTGLMTQSAKTADSNVETFADVGTPV